MDTQQQIIDDLMARGASEDEARSLARLEVSSRDVIIIDKGKKTAAPIGPSTIVD